MKPVVLLLMLLAGGAHGQPHSAVYYRQLSRACLDQNDFAQTELYADSALQSALRFNSLDSMMTAYLFLYDVHSRMKDYQKAIGNFKMASVYRDSLRTLKMKSELDSLRMILAIERESSQKELGAMKDEMALLRESADRSWLSMMPILGGLVVLLGLAVFMIYREKGKLRGTLKELEDDRLQLRAFKDKLFTVLTYDLRSSLSSFENLTRGLPVQLDRLDKTESMQFLNKLHETAGDLNTTLNNIIHWVAFQANAKPYAPLNFDCKVLAEQVIDKFRVQLTGNNLVADIFMPDGQDVYADRAMVEIIIENLVSNAIHFTPHGGAITCFSGRKDGLVTIGVKDTGVGIAREDLDKLFKTDADFHSIGKSSHKGAGVGLILSKELVEKNGGRMYVESTPGQGSTFYFSLPEKKFA